MRYTALIALMALATPMGALRASVPSAHQAVDSLTSRVWLDRGDDPVVDRGDEVRVYYRTSRDAFAAIFRIDTDGRISLLFPQHPDADPFVAGGRDYRLLFPDSPRWLVEDDPGAGYFFMVASEGPLDFSLFAYDDADGWDLSAVGDRVYEDPYVAIDDYVAAVMPDWDIRPYALDFLTYSVGETHIYPRFLCYDCHDAESYSAWNPYAYQCTTYSVVVWDDPYFHPAYRYYGPDIVVPRPLGPRPRYGITPRVSGRYGPIVRTREAPPRRIVEYKETPRAPSYMPRNPRPAPSRAIPLRPGGRGTALGRTPESAGPARVSPPRRGTATPADRARATLRRRPGDDDSPRTRGTPPPPSPRTSPTGATRPRGPIAAMRPPALLPSRGGTAGRTPPSRSAPDRAVRTPPARTRGVVRPPRSTRPPARVLPGRGTDRVGPGARPARPPVARPGAAPSKARPGGARAHPTRPGGGGAKPRGSPPRASGSPARGPRRPPPRRPPGGGAGDA